jgi:hypothetical protein
MEEKHLYHHSRLILVHKESRVEAKLVYSAPEHAFIAMLPASGLIGSVADEQLKLTTDMVGHIVCQPNGTLELIF